MATLEELIPKYGEDKANMDSLKKEVDAENTLIKKLMKDSDSGEYEAGGWVAKYSVSERVSLDEKKLLQIIKEHGVEKEGLIDTVEVLNMDVLEDLLYKNEIPQEVVVEMDSCREVKEVATLRVTRVKKENKEDE
jgi:hypothetical protein